MLLLLVVTMTLHIGSVVVGASWSPLFSLPHRGATARSPAAAPAGVTLRVDDDRHQVRILARLLN